IIGSTENLKKPDLAKMEEFYNTYYVAGNMGLILCGSFSEKEVLPILEKTFGRIRPGNPPRPVCEQPRPFNGVEQFSIKFPIPFIQARAMIWRGVPSGHEDETAMEIAIRIFSNKGGTGLLDKLHRTGKVMTAGAQFNNMNDMGAAAIFFVPKLPFGTISSAQKEATKILEQVKSGEFSDELFQQLKNEMLQDYTTLLEDLTSRGRTYAALFSSGEHWSAHEKKMDRMRALSKQDVVEVVNRYFTGNYLQVSKKTGRYPKDRIQKPPFAPLPLHNKGAKSEFAQFLETLPVGANDIRFLDLKTDAKPIKVLEGNDLVKLYTEENPINDLFTLKLNYQIGIFERPVLEQLAYYLSLLGTSKYSGDRFKDKLQQLGATLSIESYNETFAVSVRGFEAQLKPTLELLGHFLTDVKGEKKLLKKLVENKKISNKTILKSSQDMSEVLSEWVRFGRRSVYTKQLSLKETKALQADELVGELKGVLARECDIHYVGNESAENVAQLLKQYLPLDKVTEATQNPFDREAVVPKRPYIYVLPDKKSTQTTIKGYLFASPFESDQERAYVGLYSVYLGGGMNSLLFQEVRELRSLAYGAHATGHLPSKLAQRSKPTILEAHLSTQGDKATEALLLLDSLLSLRPDDAGRIEYAREALRSVISNNYPTFRKKSETAVRAVRRGFDEDPSLWLLNRVEDVDIPEFAGYISDKLQQAHPRAYSIVGDLRKLDMKALEALGEVIIVDPKKIYR
ncbi:MAG: insulinase family protein, partial [Porphyromonas sp.]|nr:insulinase family protein [Porphyromonas sp.]